MLVSEVSVSEALPGGSQWCLAQLRSVVSHGDEGVQDPDCLCWVGSGEHTGCQYLPGVSRSSQVSWGREQGAAGSWGGSHPWEWAECWGTHWASSISGCRELGVS